MRTATVRTNGTYITVTIPSREDVEALAVGQLAPYCFGESKVKSIYAKREDIKGKLFACYYVEYGDNNGSMSADIKEDEMVRNMHLCQHFTSAQLDALEVQARKVAPAQMQLERL